MAHCRFVDPTHGVLTEDGEAPQERGAAVHRVDTGARVIHLGDQHGAVAITARVPKNVPMTARRGEWS